MGLDFSDISYFYLLVEGAEAPGGASIFIENRRRGRCRGAERVSAAI